MILHLKYQSVHNDTLEIGIMWDAHETLAMTAQVSNGWDAERPTEGQLRNVVTAGRYTLDTLDFALLSTAVFKSDLILIRVWVWQAY